MIILSNLREFALCYSRHPGDVRGELELRVGVGVVANRAKSGKIAHAGAWSESIVLFEEKFSGGPLFSYFGGMRPARLCNKLYKKNAIVTRDFL